MVFLAALVVGALQALMMHFFGPPSNIETFHIATKIAFYVVATMFFTGIWYCVFHKSKENAERNDSREAFMDAHSHIPGMSGQP